MATIDHLDMYVSIAPYEQSGQTFDTLNVGVAYRKGTGFVVTYHPGRKCAAGWSCIFDFSKNPITAGGSVVAKRATRNSAKELHAMLDNLNHACTDIAALFDHREWDMLNNALRDIALYGYTDNAMTRIAETLKKHNTESINSENTPETMATKTNTAENQNVQNAQVVNPENAAMKQWNDLKAKQPETILLFRTGDFYETYCEDAPVVADILGLTLTKHADGYDLCGFPHHALDQYLPKLIRAGKRVAICDQLDGPNTKKLVKRGSSETTTDNNSSTPNNNETMATKNTTNESKSTVKNNADKAIVQPLGDHGTLVIGGCGLTPKKEETPAEPIAEQKPVTLKRKVTLKTKQPQEPIAEQPQEVAVSEGLPTVTLSTYTTKKGATAPQIIGFAGEDDPRWVRNKGKKCVSASYRRDLQGGKVYVLLFGTKYMDAARAMTDAYNTSDQTAWEAAEAQAQATLEQAQADGKAAWEAKKQEWAEKKAAREAKKAATPTATAAKTYTEAEVAALMQRVLAKDPAAMDEVSKMLEKAA